MTESTAVRPPEMAFEFQSEARVWIDLGAASTGNEYSSPLKLTISQVASLYRICGAALREYSAKSSDVLLALDDEAEFGLPS